MTLLAFYQDEKEVILKLANFTELEIFPFPLWRIVVTSIPLPASVKLYAFCMLGDIFKHLQDCKESGFTGTVKCQKYIAKLVG